MECSVALTDASVFARIASIFSSTCAYSFGSCSSEDATRRTSRPNAHSVSDSAQHSKTQHRKAQHSKARTQTQAQPEHCWSFSCWKIHSA